MANYNINAVARRVVYSGSAGVGPYAFTFEILAQTDIAAYFNNTLLTLTTDYTVTINANGTGSITIVVGTNVPTTPDADDQITITGARAIERTTDFVTAGEFRAAALNEQLDALTIFNQQISETAERAIKAPVTDPTSIDMTLPLKADRASKFLLFSATGDVGVASTDTLTVSTLQAFTDYQVDTFTGDNSTTVFTLSAEPGQKGNTQVYWDGVYQAKVNYSVVGTTLTFTTAPGTGVKVEVVHGQASSTYNPADDSLAFSKLSSAAIDTDLTSVSASHDTLPTAKATKAYVDAQVAANNELSEVLANGNTTGGTNIIVSSGDSITTNTISETTAASGVTIDGVLVKDGQVDGRDVSADGTKLDGIEAGADVTDTANVTAAGALMDSELTNITAVKALNQGVATTDSPSFAGVTASTVDINGGTIDGVTIGGSSAAAGTFTTFTSTGIDDNASSTAVTIDSSQNATFAGDVGVTAAASTATFGDKSLYVTMPDSTANRAGLRILNGSDATLAGFIAQSTTGGAYPTAVGKAEIVVANGAGITTAATFAGNGDVGIGTSTVPSGVRLKIQGGNQIIDRSGVGYTVNGNADDLAVMNTGSVGINIIGESTAGVGQLLFGTNVDSSRGGLKYTYSTDELEISTAGPTAAITIDSSQNATFAGDVTINSGDNGYLEIKTDGLTSSAVSLKLSAERGSGGLSTATLAYEQDGGASRPGLSIDVGNDNIYLSAQGTNGVFIQNQSGATTLATFTNNGLTFHGDTAAANALDDYEEGTWTPSVTFGGLSVGITYGQQYGNYTKIGNLVIAKARIVLTSKGSSTGNAAIAGLPFTILNNNNQGSGVQVGSTYNMTGLVSSITGAGNANSTTCNLYDWLSSGTSGSNITESNFTDSSVIHVTVTYQV